jgi:hypothetical protein
LAGLGGGLASVMEPRRLPMLTLPRRAVVTMTDDPLRVADAASPEARDLSSDA